MRVLLAIVATLILAQCASVGPEYERKIYKMADLESGEVPVGQEICLTGTLYSAWSFSSLSGGFIGPDYFDHVQIVDDQGNIIFGDKDIPEPHRLIQSDTGSINGWLSAIRPKVLLERGGDPLSRKQKPVVACGVLITDGTIVLDSLTYDYQLVDWSITQLN